MAKVLTFSFVAAMVIFAMQAKAATHQQNANLNVGANVQASKGRHARDSDPHVDVQLAHPVRTDKVHNSESLAHVQAHPQSSAQTTKSRHARDSDPHVDVQLAHPAHTDKVHDSESLAHVQAHPQAKVATNGRHARNSLSKPPTHADAHANTQPNSRHTRNSVPVGLPVGVGVQANANANVRHG